MSTAEAEQETTPARPGEVAITLPNSTDAGLHFIGHIETPWASRQDCPRNGRQREDLATIVVDPRYAAALEGIERCSHIIVLYWMNEARRDLVRQAPRHMEGASRGTFALRSPVRPNPIALSVVELVGVAGTRLTVRHIDCKSGTPLLDIKPYYASTDSVPDATRP